MMRVKTTSIKTFRSSDLPAVTSQPHLLGEVGNLIHPQAASRGDGTVEEAWVQQRLVHVPAGLVLSLATQAGPEVIILLTLSNCLKLSCF